jgi:hypothetical protein
MGDSIIFALDLLRLRHRLRRFYSFSMWYVILVIQRSGVLA